MKLGVHIGYWGATPPAWAPGAIEEAERLGFDSMWTAESWGSDAFTPLAWWGSRTTKLRLGTNLVQLSARTPTATAMAAPVVVEIPASALRNGKNVIAAEVHSNWTNTTDTTFDLELVPSTEANA